MPAETNKVRSRVKGLLPNVACITIKINSHMAYQQPALPYADNALEPHISANTIGFHYGKHHAAYVKNYNGFVEGTP